MSGIIGGIKGAMKKKISVQAGGDANWSGVSLLLTGDDLLDHSSSVKSLSVSGASVSTSVKKYGSGSLYFNGSSQYISGTTGFALGTGDFTVDMWVYKTTTMGTWHCMCTNRDSGGSNGLWMGFAANSNAPIAYTVSGQIATSSTSISLNTWTHIAYCRSGSTLTIYVNGVATATASTSSSFTNASGSVGYDLAYNSFSFAGYIDDLRITPGVARYTANFTPPTAALPSASVSYHPQWGNRYVNTSDVFNISSSVTTSGSDYIVTDAYSVQWKILANFANATPTRWGGAKYINVSNTSGANSITSLANGNYANSDMATRIVPGTIYSDCVSPNSQGGTNRCSWHTDSASDAYPSVTTAVKNAITANNATFYDGVTSSTTTNFCASMFFEPPTGTSEVLLNFGSYYGGTMPNSVFVVNKATGALVGNPIVFSNQSGSAPTDLNGTTSRNVLFRHTAGYVYFVMEMHYTIAYSQFILYR